MEFEVTMADIAKKPKRVAPDLCIRCKQNPPAITMRSEAICQVCFVSYVRTKFTRHMEPYRVKPGTENQRRKIMLATSFGMCSTALLDLLHWHQALQLARARRAEYDVYVVHVDESALIGGGEDEGKAIEGHLQKLRGQYSRFEFMSVPLECIYEFGNVAVDELVSTAGDLSLDQESAAESSKPPPSTSQERLRALLSSLNSRASQMDIASILRTRLLVEIATKNSFEAVFFADSMTKMAAMVLAEVTKGRGHALPWLISDGPTPYGKPAIVRPIRDVAKNEILEFVTFSSLWPFSTISKETASSPPKPVANGKNQTIDDVMGKFFEDVSNSHLSANVVKTAGKLEFKDDRDRVERLGLCDICGLPMDEDPKARARRLAAEKEGDENKTGDKFLDADARIYCLEPPEGEEGLKERRCYGCRRSTLGAGKIQWPLSNK
ncbi:hypothetical protein ABW20_dc0110070 [Dactylellina cionopaga]|nr:hypothetical protein ABW20_dc0110070 [Dactylellina cionopaga]